MLVETRRDRPSNPIAGIASRRDNNWFEGNEMEEPPNETQVVVAAGGEWAETDQSFIRVLEDLIETLVEKKVIALSDLPAPAQQKIIERRELRGSIEGIITEDEKIEY